MKIFDTSITLGKIFQERPYPQAFTFQNKDQSIYFKWLPFIYMGQFNPDLDGSDVKKVMLSVEHLFNETKSDTHRLAQNYSANMLKYEKMYVFGIVWDMNKSLPVCISGLQDIGSVCGRLLSRYYVFSDYRTNGKNTFKNDIDDYAMLKIQKLMGERSFDLMFISRDTNHRYFQRLKKYRTDVYKDFDIYSHKIELLYENNWQNIFYYKNNIDQTRAQAIIQSLEYSSN